MKHFNLILLFIMAFSHVQLKGQSNFNCTDSLYCENKILCLNEQGIFLPDLELCNPSGGNYLNEFILDNTFYPQNAGLGEHEITYQLNDDTCYFIITIIDTIGPAGIISGVQVICTGTTEEYSIEAVPGTDSYLWHYNSSDWLTTEPSIGILFVDTCTLCQLTVLAINSCDIGTSSSININVIDAPEINISGPSDVCKNSYWVEYSAIPEIEGFSLDWSVNGGEIMTGQHTYSIKVHWSEIADSGLVSLERHNWNNGDCKNYSELLVNIGPDIAPDTVTIVAKNNDLTTGILICPQGYNIYSWGYENRSDNIEINSCFGENYCFFENLDTLQYLFWVKIGFNVNCLTKNYLNFPFFYYSSDYYFADNNIVMMYDVNSDEWIIEILDEYLGKITIILLDIYGRKIQNFSFTKSKIFHREIFNIQKFPTGIYFLLIQSKGFNFSNKIFINNN